MFFKIPSAHEKFQNAYNMLSASFNVNNFFLRYLFLIAIYNHIFPIRLVFFPFLSELIMAVSIFPFFVLVLLERLTVNLTVSLKRFYFFLFATFLILFLLGFFSYLYSNSVDHGFIIILFNFTSKFIYIYLLIYWAARLFNTVEEFKFFLLKSVFWSGFIVALSVIFEVFVPGFKEVLLSIFLKTSNINFDTSLRASGFATGGGASQSLVLCTTFSFGLIISRFRRFNSFESLLYISCAMLVLFSIIFVGRTGLYFALFLMVFWYLFLSGLRSLFRLSLAVFTFSAIVFYFYSIGLLNLEKDNFEFYLSHSFEIFNNFLEHGTLQADSTNEVSKMLYLPSAEHFIFGAGFVGQANHGYYLPDPGVMKVLFAFGVFGLIVFYIFNLIAAREFLRFFYSFSDKVINLFVLLLLILFFVFEFKEPGLYQNYNFKVFSLIVVAGLYSKYLALVRK